MFRVFEIFPYYNIEKLNLQKKIVGRNFYRFVKNASFQTLME